MQYFFVKVTCWFAEFEHLIILFKADTFQKFIREEFNACWNNVCSYRLQLSILNSQCHQTQHLLQLPQLEKWKNEFIYVFITSFSSVPDSSMFFVQYKETLRHLINKAFLRYNMWCYYFQTFHKEILHDGESRILFPAAISLQTPTLVMPLTLSTSPFSCPAIPKTYNFLPK